MTLFILSSRGGIETPARMDVNVLCEKIPPSTRSTRQNAAVPVLTLRSRWCGGQCRIPYCLCPTRRALFSGFLQRNGPTRLPIFDLTSSEKACGSYWHRCPHRNALLLFKRYGAPPSVSSPLDLMLYRFSVTHASQPRIKQSHTPPVRAHPHAESKGPEMGSTRAYRNG